MKSGQDMSIANALDRHYQKLTQKDQRPNVLVIMTDQQRYDTIAAMGYDHMYTPNLDRLVCEGTSYKNAYSPNPICCPARHTFISGLSSKDHGIADNDFNARLNPSIVTFPKVMSHGGYVTEAIGKMHFQPSREHHGFQRLKLMEEVPENRYDDDYLSYLNEKGFGNVQNIHGIRNLLFFLPQQAILPEEHHGTTWVTDRGIEFLNDNAGKRPFLLYLSYIAPHPPFNSYEKYSKLYEGRDLPKPLQSITPLKEITKENKMHGDLPTDAYVRRVREVYFGMISQIDVQIGRVLETLEQKGELDHTLIIFTSDHGELLGDYGCVQKFLPYDACAKIPFVVRYPEQFEAGKVCEDFVDLSDIFPTVLEVAGFNYHDEKLIGESLVAQVAKKDREHQYVSYSEGSRRWASIRNKRYKYTYYYGGGLKELYDLQNDPGERANLLYDNTDVELDKVVAELHTRLKAYEKAQWKEEYFDGNELVVLEPYVAVPTRNKAFPQYLRQLSYEDLGNTNDFIDEVIDAAKDEAVVKFEELDITAFKKNSNFSDEDIQRLLEQRKTTKEK